MSNRHPKETSALSEEYRHNLLISWDKFKKQHGVAIRNLGWTRQTMLSGLDPATAKDWQEMPAMALMVHGGAVLVAANRDWIEFRWGHSDFFRVKDGWLNRRPAGNAMYEPNKSICVPFILAGRDEEEKRELARNMVYGQQ